MTHLYIATNVVIFFLLGLGTHSRPGDRDTQRSMAVCTKGRRRRGRRECRRWGDL